MAIKITDLGQATLPLAGTEVLEIVQDGDSRQVAADDIAASASGLDATFVTISANAVLPNERVLTAGANINIVDGGPNSTVTINVVGLVTTLAALSDVDLSGQAIGDLLFNKDGTNWEDTAGLLMIDEGAFRFISGYTIQANGGIALVNANGEIFLDNVFLGGGAFAYTIDVGGNTAVYLQDNGLVRIGLSGGTENTIIQSGIEISLVRNGLDEIALSLAPAAGGLSVNNTLTGAGLERVLTESDLSSGGAAGSITYAFDSTLGGDPGSGNFRMSTANPANIAALYFSDDDLDGLDIQNILGTLTVGCHIIMRNTADNSQWRVYVVGTITDNAGWYQFNVDEADGNGDATIGAVGTEIEFEFFSSGWVQPGVNTGTNNDEIAYWNPSNGYWEGSGTLITVNVGSPPLGGRLQLGTTSGFNTTSPQIMRPLGAADTCMDFVFGTDPNNGFYQRYGRVAGERVEGARIASVNTDMLAFNLSAQVVVDAGAGFFMEEKGADHGNVAGLGEFWVRNDSPNTPMFTTDTGVDIDLSATGGLAAGTVTNATLRWSGAAWVEITQIQHIFAGATTLQIDGSGAFLHLNTTGAGVDEKETRIKMDNFAGFAIQSVTDGGSNGPFLLGANRTGTAWQELDIQTDVRIFAGDLAMQGGSVYIEEVAAALADAADFGQFWVRDDAPNTPMFTDDTGVDFVLNAGLTPPFTFLDNEHLFFGTGDDFDFFFNAVNMEIVGPGGGSVMLVTGIDQFRIAGALGILEAASPDGNIAGIGQYWVRSSAPARPTFTDDTDIDQLLDPSISEIVSVVASRTLILTDKGKTIGFTGGTVAQTMTIPAGASVAYQIGTIIAFDNTGSVSYSIAITTDTLRFAADNSTGTRTLAAGGYASAQKVTATEWKIAGSGLS